MDVQPEEFSHDDFQIKDQKYAEAIQYLNLELQRHPKVCLVAVGLVVLNVSPIQSRAALSLLGFCFYRAQDYASAADW